jgi:hypothetical protein
MGSTAERRRRRKVFAKKENKKCEKKPENKATQAHRHTAGNSSIYTINIIHYKLTHCVASLQYWPYLLHVDIYLLCIARHERHGRSHITFIDNRYK